MDLPITSSSLMLYFDLVHFFSNDKNNAHLIRFLTLPFENQVKLANILAIKNLPEKKQNLARFRQKNGLNMDTIYTNMTKIWSKYGQNMTKIWQKYDQNTVVLESFETPASILG